MAEAPAEIAPTFNLLDLPDAALSIIIACLSDSDQKMIMTACRKTFDMAMLNAEITVKVTKDSKFPGFRQVLNSSIHPASIHLEITCPAGKQQNSNALHQEPLSTIAVLMGMVPDSTLTQLAASCQGEAWERITKVTIKGAMMRCLVPRFIALTCPQLVEIIPERPLYTDRDQHIFNTDPAAALPLESCTSLKHVKLNDWRPNLPSSYHSPAELRRNLPNIDTLIFMERHDVSLMNAFAGQLTSLRFHGYRYDMNEIQQVVRPCSNLQHLSVPQLALPDNTANLKTLDLDCDLTDRNMQLLLSLPNLTELRLPTLGNIDQDWSHHACPWQKLHLSESLHFTKLANLNLSSFRHLSVGPDVEVCLPDPSDPSSLTVVQHVVARLSHEQLVIIQNNIKMGSYLGRFGAMQWDIPNSGSEHEQAAAELIRVAAQCIGSCRQCNCEALTHRPLSLSAVLKWGQSFIESVCLGRNYEHQPFVWQALQQLDRLHTVVFWAPDKHGHNPNRQGYANEMVNIPKAISSAAQLHVIPANKSLRIEYVLSDNNLETAAVTETRTSLREAILKVLPAGCQLSSVEYACMAAKHLNSFYGWEGALWAAVIQPLHSIASGSISL